MCRSVSVLTLLASVIVASHDSSQNLTLRNLREIRGGDVPGCHFPNFGNINCIECVYSEFYSKYTSCNPMYDSVCEEKSGLTYNGVCREDAVQCPGFKKLFSDITENGICIDYFQGTLDDCAGSYLYATVHPPYGNVVCP